MRLIAEVARLQLLLIAFISQFLILSFIFTGQLESCLRKIFPDELKEEKNLLLYQVSLVSLQRSLIFFHSAVAPMRLFQELSSLNSELLEYEDDDLLCHCLSTQVLQHATILLVTRDDEAIEEGVSVPDYMRSI